MFQFLSEVKNRVVKKKTFEKNVEIDCEIMKKVESSKKSKVGEDSKSVRKNGPSLLIYCEVVKKNL